MNIDIYSSTEKIVDFFLIHPQYQDLKKICVSLYDGKNYARFVGGAVRDILLKYTPHDFDITTGLTPDEVIQQMKDIGAHVIETGISHGTVTVIINKLAIEVTTLRHDIQCDGRHAEVKFLKDFEKDAARRDFTINALSFCIVTEKLYDYFSGINDLYSHKVTFIGEPIQRIKEDALRIMRFFRFSAYYADFLDNRGMLACLQYKDLLFQISQERITSELNKILVSKKVIYILNNMNPLYSILAFQNIDISLLEQFINHTNDEHNCIQTIPIESIKPYKLETIYALLFINHNTMQLKSHIKKYKLSKKCMNRIIILHEYINLILLNKFHFFLKKKCILKDELSFIMIMLAIIYSKDTVDINLFIALYNKKIIFPLNGYDILKLGYKNYEIKKQLDYAFKIWIESGCKFNSEELLLILMSE